MLALKQKELTRAKIIMNNYIIEHVKTLIILAVNWAVAEIMINNINHRDLIIYTE
jgi:hypothetical protein